VPGILGDPVVAAGEVPGVYVRALPHAQPGPFFLEKTGLGAVAGDLVVAEAEGIYAVDEVDAFLAVELDPVASEVGDVGRGDEDPGTLGEFDERVDELELRPVSAVRPAGGETVGAVDGLDVFQQVARAADFEVALPADEDDVLELVAISEEGDGVPAFGRAPLEADRLRSVGSGVKIALNVN